jgi:hypothetical protein
MPNPPRAQLSVLMDAELARLVRTLCRIERQKLYRYVERALRTDLAVRSAENPSLAELVRKLEAVYAQPRPAPPRAAVEPEDLREDADELGPYAVAS